MYSFSSEQILLQLALWSLTRSLLFLAMLCHGEQRCLAAFLQNCLFGHWCFSSAKPRVTQYICRREVPWWRESVQFASLCVAAEDSLSLCCGSTSYSMDWDNLGKCQRECIRTKEKWSSCSSCQSPRGSWDLMFLQLAKEQFDAEWVFGRTTKYLGSAGVEWV